MSSTNGALDGNLQLNKVLTASTLGYDGCDFNGAHFLDERVHPLAHGRRFTMVHKAAHRY